MIDALDASDDRLRLAVARALSTYGDAELLECVADHDPILRTAAARALHVRGTRAICDHALALTTHPRHDMREIGAFILSQLGTPEKPFADESFAALGPLLEDPYWEVRYAAAMAVGFLADADRQPPQAMRDRIIELARDESADVRAGVAVALGSIHHPVAAASLSRLLDDGDPGVQQDAELGLELRDVYGFDGGTRAAAE